MLDDDDLDTFIIISPDRGPWWLIVGGVLIVIIVAIIVSGNHTECEAKHCPDGLQPILANHECLCVRKAE